MSLKIISHLNLLIAISSTILTNLCLACPVAVAQGRAGSSKLAAVKYETRSEFGLHRVIYTTSQGAKIFLNVPSDLAAGDVFSGTVTIEPAGVNELNGYVLKLGNQSVPVTAGAFTVALPAALDGTDIPIVLLDKSENEIARTELPISPRPSRSPKTFTIPTLGQVGGGIEIEGPFDGRFDDADYLKIGGHKVSVVAESPRKRVALNTGEALGLTVIESSERGDMKKSEFRNLSVKVSSPKARLGKGERTTLVVEVRGLQGLRGSLPLHLENSSTDVLSMEKGERQLVLIKPESVQPDGVYKLTRTLTGAKVGDFSIAATLQSNVQIEYTREDEYAAGNGISKVELLDWTFSYFCQSGKPLCGSFKADVYLRSYTQSLPPTMRVLNVWGIGNASGGWSHFNPNSQSGFCQVYSFSDSTAEMGNAIHVVKVIPTQPWNPQTFPVPVSVATCAYTVKGIPTSGIVSTSVGDSLFGISTNGELIRKYQAGGQWNTEIIPHWGPRLIVGSLIRDDGTGGSGKIYGVNAHGAIFNTWNNNGVITFGLLPGLGIIPGSLVMSNGNGVFGVTHKAKLARKYFANGQWNTQIMPYWAESIVAGSLIAGEGTGANAKVYGVNKNGQVFHTWNNNGVTTFDIIPGTINIIPESLALSNGNGVFGINKGGDLIRIYLESGQWKTEIISHWGGDLVADSLITGEGAGAYANIYGVNANGQIFTTWNNNGVITFGLVPGTQSILPDSLALSNGNGVFSVNSAGDLVRIFWNGQWNTEIIPSQGGKPVATSVIPGNGTGTNADVYGVNENGAMFTTKNNNGVITYTVIP